MQLRGMLRLLIIGAYFSSLAFAGCSQQRQFGTEAQEESTPSVQTRRQAPDVPYVPTPQAVVERMLEIARVNQNDIVYDLGSGDGRIPINAAQRYGTRGVGIDINPERIQEANQNAHKAGLAHRVQFRQQDLFQTEFSDATVVILYLLPEINMKLRPKLLKELKPGTRIISHAFDMGDWQPQRVEQVDGSIIYLWVVPQKVPENLRS